MSENFLFLIIIIWKLNLELVGSNPQTTASLVSLTKLSGKTKYEREFAANIRVVPSRVVARGSLSWKIIENKVKRCIIQFLLCPPLQNLPFGNSLSRGSYLSGSIVLIAPTQLVFDRSVFYIRYRPMNNIAKTRPVQQLIPNIAKNHSRILTWNRSISFRATIHRPQASLYSGSVANKVEWNEIEKESWVNFVEHNRSWRYHKPLPATIISFMPIINKPVKTLVLCRHTR